MNKALIKFSALMLLAASSHTATFAADPPKSVSDFAMYQGSDRHERLVEAAKKEGELSVYHVYPNLTIILDAFSKKYGIKIKSWRSGSESVLQRVVAESRAGKADVDIMQNNAPENEAAHREKIMQEVHSPYFKDLVPQAVPSHKEWAGITIDVFSGAYNTKMVKKEDLPKSYQDLLDPKWKGKLGIEAEDQGWFNTLIDTMGEAKGLKLFNDIVATNGVTVRKGHSLLATLAASGEVPLPLSVYSWTPEQLKQKGAPIEMFTISPVVAQFSTIAMAKKAPHPAAAALFYDFMLSEGQQQLANLKYVPTSKSIKTNVSGIQMTFIDPGTALDMQDKWVKVFQDTIVKKAR